MRTVSLLAVTLGWLLLPTAAGATACGDPASPIARIQGSGPSSPKTGQQVTVEGIITLDTRYPGGFNGFFVQQADADTDHNPATSEALFVYTRNTAGKAGDRVRITGTATEFHGLTQLHRVTRITACGPGVLPAPLTIPWPPGRGAEAVEGMLVTIQHPMVVVEHHNLLRYGELTLAADDQRVPTQWLLPGPESFALEHRQTQQRLLLDDGYSRRFPPTISYLPAPLGPRRTLRTGTLTHGLTGIIDYRFGHWRLQPVTAPRFETTNPRRPAPARGADVTLRVTAMNLQNYFNGDGRGGGFPTPRGARTPDEADTQRRRLAAALRATNSDIITVTELENDGPDEFSALAALARELGPDWRYVQDNNPGEDAIRGAILYRHGRTRPVGPAAYPTRSEYPHPARPPLAQSFSLADGGSVRVVVTHFKSKNCRGARGRERDQRDGQSCFAHRRTQSARALARWLEELPAATGSRGTLLTGDLNSYAREAPLKVLARAGYTDLVRHFSGLDNHSFRYRGRRGTLDYSLASQELLPYVSHSEIWAINADEPAALGYRHGGQHQTAPSPWRSSDHDPVITDLTF
ncbi:ExeM/NucH family extracellular endonuclease [Marinobacter sp. X15-166B]|uniref:ExeM/NucH family extracellular endonuclease n=1 Tax=Marinobacter sp. X15-166B TaxID=1897620 RepID=UPI00085C1EEC|nr:ExeM/NucH family extracellular endonuclease [Marinobacter sp. X15-166B]OEY66191.1 hypothetical protein BG841_06780 [Marinobacter sp. X15-166B]